MIFKIDWYRFIAPQQAKKQTKRDIFQLSRSHFDRVIEVFTEVEKKEKSR